VPHSRELRVRAEPAARLRRQWSRQRGKSPDVRPPDDVCVGDQVRRIAEQRRALFKARRPSHPLAQSSARSVIVVRCVALVKTSSAFRLTADTCLPTAIVALRDIDSIVIGIFLGQDSLDELGVPGPLVRAKFVHDGVFDRGRLRQKFLGGRSGSPLDENQ